MNVVNKRLDELRPYANNPRINDEAAKAVAKSIKAYGFKVPMVITADGEIVCGHTRYKAAKILGLEEVPCVVADDLTPEQVKAFRLVDNKTGELAGWDFTALEAELEELGEDMSEFGFFDTCISDDELSDMINAESDDKGEKYKVEVICQDEEEQERALSVNKDNGFYAIKK